MDDETVLTDMTRLLGGASGTTTVAGRYRLQHVIGVGGLAVVHRAVDTRLERPVAVKLLRETTTSAADRARFVSEARLLGRLSHPNLVRVLDAGVDDDHPFLVLDLVEGRTLAEALEAGLTPQELARTGAGIASALAHAHAAGIVHRDVKPGNVLLARDGTPRLADFGIARLVDDTCHQTSTGMLVGTVAYLAPEQVAGEPVTTAADVYALGLVLLEGLTRRRAYSGPSVESALARLSRQPDVPVGLPAGWRALLLAMTARDPAARPTAAEVAERLRAPAAAVPPPAPVRRGLSSRVALVGAGAAFLMLVGAAGWSSLPTPPGSASAASAHRAPARTPAPAAQAEVAVPDAEPVTAAVSPPAPERAKRHHHRSHRARHHAHHRARHHAPAHPRHHHHAPGHRKHRHHH